MLNSRRLEPLKSRHPADERGGAGNSRTRPEAEPAPVDSPEPVIVCRVCGFAICHPDDAITVAGAHRHTFANPHGIVFEIGCFGNAPGCARVGAATDDFTWFAGYRWRIALCAGCHEHLGWRFEGAGDSFYGLILDRLVFPA
jgi:hypothetical protein